MSYDIGIRFLDLFQDNKSLGQDASKFVKTFSMGQILAECGQSLKDSTNECDALEAVRHLCAKNRAEHHYEEKPEMLDKKYPGFSGSWFVKSMCKTQEYVQTVSKNLGQQVDLKNLAQLEEAKLFMEGMGLNKEKSTSRVQVEHPKADGLTKKNELLKQPHLD